MPTWRTCGDSACNKAHLTCSVIRDGILPAQNHQNKMLRTQGELKPINAALSYMPHIDGLRALAVAIVVFFHAFPKLLPGGFVGVDVFFVISGYLIASGSMVSGRSFSVIDFYKRRSKRILPALIVVLLFCYVVGFNFFLVDEFKQLGAHIFASATFWQNFNLWREAGYFDTASELKPLIHLWSLAVEEQFYLAYPFLAAFCHGKGPKFTRRTLFFLAALSFGANLYAAQHDAVGDYFSPLSRVWEILAGCFLAQFAPSDLGARKSEALSVLGLFLIALSLPLANERAAYPNFIGLLPVVGSAMLIRHANHAKLVRVIFTHKATISVGLLSYSLYLWHWPLLSLLAILAPEHSGDFRYKLAIIFLSYLLAHGTLKFVENPIRFGADSKSKFFGVVATLLFVGALGYNADVRDGMNFRRAAKVSNERNQFDYKYKHDCARLTGSISTEDWCGQEVDGNAAPSVIVIGDSVSNGFSEVFKEFKKHHPEISVTYDQFGRGQCPPLLAYGPAACRDFNEKVRGVIQHLTSTTTVVLAADWGMYSGGKDFNYGEKIESAGDFKYALNRTISAYKNLGHRVLFFYAPPIGGNPRACIARTGAVKSNESCGSAILKVLAAENGYRDAVADILTAGAVETFDPRGLFCGPEQCKMVNNESILFYDSRHISVAGAAFIAGQGDAELMRLFSTR